MKPLSLRSPITTFGRPLKDQARVAVVLLVVIAFGLGLGVSVFWFYRNTSSGGTGEIAQTATGELSDVTRKVLQQLHSEIEVRYYSLLDPAGVSDSLESFARRVDQLLSRYQQVADGKIHLIRINSDSTANADAAVTNGLRSFNLGNGSGGYLGVVISGNGQKEVLAQLSPEWEAAVQFDLTRAIERVNNAKPPTRAAILASQNAPEVIAEVKRAIPDLDSISFEQGSEILRKTAMQDFATVANQMQAQIQEAQQHLAEAQSSKSEAQQQAAMKNLQQVQAEQTARIKQIASRLQNQIAALRQLKQK